MRRRIICFRAEWSNKPLENCLFPLILIVVPTLGTRRDWLRASIVSILSQEGVEVRVRVVAPSEASLGGLCTELGAELVECDRKGLSVAINEGWKDTGEAEFLTWLGDDDLLAPGSLAATSAALAARPNAPMVYGAVRYIDAAGNSMWLQRPGRFAAWYLPYGKNLVPQQGSLLRKSFVMAAGGIDEACKSAMDQDLFSRLLECGPSAYVRQEVAAFRIHESNITVNKGNEGADEGERIRARHAGRFYPLIRRVTVMSDRLIYALIRRWPYKAPPVVNGKPYTIAYQRVEDDAVG
ncbi:glycosyltransferase [Burkholderia sp. RS01]|uniref:glycosyltransferase n=1 Tax=unclassified Burkholderia TaxID=2613784 RepID=UPI0032189B5E